MSEIVVDVNLQFEALSVVIEPGQFVFKGIDDERYEQTISTSIYNVIPVAFLLPTVTEVRIEYCYLDENRCFSLAKCLYTNNTVKKLCLDADVFPCKGLKAIGEAICQSNTLTNVSIFYPRVRENVFVHDCSEVVKKKGFSEIRSTHH